MSKGLLLESVALAKAILARRGINQESPEWADYLRIREMCARTPGWVGLITRIRFVDGVEDLDELESVLKVLVSSSMDSGSLMKLTYDQILDRFHDSLVPKGTELGYEVVVRDKLYTIYRVHTYEGIMRIGSPAWCLKTRSNWDKYQVGYPYQFVAIHNDWVGKLISPDTNYLGGYSNKARPWVRYGFSLDVSSEGEPSLPIVFDDDNNYVGLDRWNGHRSLSPAISRQVLGNVFHIYLTIINVVRGDLTPATTRLSETTLLEPGRMTLTLGKSKAGISNFEMMLPGSRLGPVVEAALPGDTVDLIYRFDPSDKKFYLTLYWLPLASTWNYVRRSPQQKTRPLAVHFHRDYTDGASGWSWETWTMGPKLQARLIDHYSKQQDRHTCGIRLDLGLITKQEVESIEGFVARINDWLVFDWGGTDYTLLNAAPSKGFSVPFKTLTVDTRSPVVPTLVSWIDKDSQASHDEESGFFSEVRREMRRMGLFNKKDRGGLFSLFSRRRG